MTAPPPNSGGVAVAQWIGMLEAYDATHDLPAQNSTEYIHVMSEIGKRVFADRAEYMGDPDFVSVPVKRSLTLTILLNAQQIFSLPAFLIPQALSLV